MIRRWSSRGRTALLSLIALGMTLTVLRANAQTKINSNHTCEYACRGARPACEAAWRPNISAVFLGTATEVLSEDVPILLDGEKVGTTKLAVKFKVEEAFVGVNSPTVSVALAAIFVDFHSQKANDIWYMPIRTKETHCSMLISAAKLSGPVNRKKT